MFVCTYILLEMCMNVYACMCECMSLCVCVCVCVSGCVYLRLYITNLKEPTWSQVLTITSS